MKRKYDGPMQSWLPFSTKKKKLMAQAVMLSYRRRKPARENPPKKG